MSTLGQDTHTPHDNSIGYAMLLMDELKLLIPQKQILALEMSKDMDISEASDSVVGHLPFNNKSWPIFCFNNKLTPQTSASLNHQFCVLVQTDSASFGILSEQALLLNSEEIRLQLLPEAMLTVDTPISALAVYTGEVICISSTEHLAKQLPLSLVNGN